MKSQYSISRFLYLILLVWSSSLSKAAFSEKKYISSFNRLSTCRLQIKKEHGVVSMCSGSLVKKNQILTAAHCILSDATEVLAQCGYKGLDVRNVTYSSSGSHILNGLIFSEEISVKKVVLSSTADDQAILQLEHDSNILPMRLAHIDQVELNKCLFSGFGINNSGYAGLFNSVVLPDLTYDGNKTLESVGSFQIHFQPPFGMDIKDIIYDVVRRAVSKTGQGAFTLFGDSGGPVICKVKNSTEFRQIAVVSQLKYEFNGGPMMPTIDELKESLRTGNPVIVEEKTEYTFRGTSIFKLVFDILLQTE